MPPNLPPEITAVNPFKPVVRIVAPLLRWRLKPAQEIPIERPPRGRPPAARTHIVWSGGQLHPFPLTVSHEPEREETWRR
jgi:hypothetical protein